MEYKLIKLENVLHWYVRRSYPAFVPAQVERLWTLNKDFNDKLAAMRCYLQKTSESSGNQISRKETNIVA